MWSCARLAEAGIIYASEPRCMCNDLDANVPPRSNAVRYAYILIEKCRGVDVLRRS